ncbi:SPFH domain-containing protein [Streptosporangium longisporum]|uniref:SPFH domain-containing protein n=1 Tax=Streptosporangium longisporum TaxID=46187 RepID=UPI0039A47CAC
MESLVATLVVLAVAAFAAYRTVHVVPQGTAGVVERFGRYHRTLGPGPNLVVPFIDRIRDVVDLREQAVSFPPRPVVTRDHLVVSVDAAVCFRVADARAATYEIANFLLAVEQLTVTVLRDAIGSRDLEDALASRGEIGTELCERLGRAAEAWGVRIGRAELKAIDPPVSVRESMERHACAERDRRAAVLAAEGRREAAVLDAEGTRQAAVLRAQGEAEAAVLAARAEADARRERAVGEAEAAEMLLKAVREGGPGPEVLTYAYLRTLLEIAEGDPELGTLSPRGSSPGSGAFSGGSGSSAGSGGLSGSGGPGGSEEGGGESRASSPASGGDAASRSPRPAPAGSGASAGPREAGTPPVG